MLTYCKTISKIRKIKEAKTPHDAALIKKVHLHIFLYTAKKTQDAVEWQGGLQMQHFLRDATDYVINFKYYNYSKLF